MIDANQTFQTQIIDNGYITNFSRFYFVTSITWTEEVAKFSRFGI